MRRRDLRERQALKFLMHRRCAAAVDLGKAATAGEDVRRHADALGTLGMKLGNHFIKRGFARLDGYNRYVWVQK